MSSPPPPSPPPPPLQNEPVQIREVWGSNLEQEFLLIRDLVHKYPYIGMDTEFPGIVCRTTDSTSFYNYATLKTNVDMLKLIQIGLTFSDAAGNLPDLGTGVGCIWQFNFREFDLRSDPYASDSIELLRGSDIDFVRNREHGVDARRFSELMMSSGVVLNDDVLWVTFHCAYDFGYLLKILTWTNLPDTQAEFVTLVKVFFPILYDIKHIMMFRSNLHGSLDKLSEILGVKRVGLSHQAGSDSMVTLLSFFKMKDVYFSGSVEKYAGVLYGLGC